MNLYNCYSEQEIELKNVELNTLSEIEKFQLISKIKSMFNDGILEDEIIVTDALFQIAFNLLEEKININSILYEMAKKDNFNDLASLANFYETEGYFNISDEIYIILESDNRCFSCGSELFYDESFYQKEQSWRCPKCDKYIDC